MEPGSDHIPDPIEESTADENQTFQILNSDDHANFLKKQNRNPADYMPDIVHQALLAILDSPLTKAGRLQALYVRTEKGALFEVKPHVRMPRTFKRFCGLMRLSYSSEKMVQLRDYVDAATDDVSLVFVVGAMAHGKIRNDYTNDFISRNVCGLRYRCKLEPTFAIFQIRMRQDSII